MMKESVTSPRRSACCRFGLHSVVMKNRSGGGEASKPAISLQGPEYSQNKACTYPLHDTPQTDKETDRQTNRQTDDRDDIDDRDAREERDDRNDKEDRDDREKAHTRR